MKTNGKEDLRVRRTLESIRRAFEELMMEKDYEKIKTISTDVTVIGYMTDNTGVAEMITPDNHVIPIKAQGWDHMRKKQE